MFIAIIPEENYPRFFLTYLKKIISTEFNFGEI